MADFGKLLKLVGKGVEEVAPKAEELAKGAKKLHYSELPDEPMMLKPKSDAAFAEELAKINDRRRQSGSFELTPEQYRAYTEKREMPVEKMVGGPKHTPQPESGPATLADSNKLYNPEMSGKVNYKPTSKGIMPMAAAGDLFTDLQNSPLGDAATQWNKIKGMLAGKAAKEMDLTGGKDPQFQGAAKTVLGATMDPANLIPGVGGLAAGGLEMLGRDEDEETEKLKKKP